MNADFHSALKAAAEAIDRRQAESAQIFHHNDADGLSCAAILSTALSIKRIDAQRCCLEKPYPEVLHQIFRQEGRLLIFADFAGRIASWIAELNRGRNLVLILDHHAAQPVEASGLHHLNPELHGMKGDRDISASTVCYRFVRELDTCNVDLAHLAVVGAVGDRFFEEGRLTGENRRAMMNARDQGTIAIDKEGLKEAYVYYAGAGERMPVKRIVEMIETLGAAGYYQGGAELGIECLVDGFSGRARDRFKALESFKKSAFNRMVKRLKAGGLNQSTSIQWFHAGNEFMPMGVKIIGLFCQYIRRMDFVDAHKYIAGFQRLPDEVPGFGRVNFNADKISMRVPPLLATRIRKGQQPGLDTFFAQATNRLGGFSDGCHSLAAATTLGRGKEEALIQAMESILDK
jgi:single-stranded DNA-specific DHH superfamily exonuclease